MKNCSTCEDPQNCVSCEVQIKDNQPLSMMWDIAKASNFFNGQIHPFKKLQHEMFELGIPSSKIETYFNDRHEWKESFIEESSHVLFHIIRCMQVLGLSFADLENNIIIETKQEFSEQWEKVINERHNTKG
jgi:phosphoribosyl-ATP pyrophosphohydrolase